VTFLCIRIQPLIVSSGTATAGLALRAVVDVSSYDALKSAPLIYSATVLLKFSVNYG